MKQIIQKKEIVSYSYGMKRLENEYIATPRRKKLKQTSSRELNRQISLLKQMDSQFEMDESMDQCVDHFLCFYVEFVLPFPLDGFT